MSHFENVYSGASAVAVRSIAPISLSAPWREVDLEVRVSAPIAGDALPILLLSHGHGHSNNLASLHGYAPLANAWAARGFVVIQPTHLNSKTLANRLNAGDPEGPLYWRSRPKDMSTILDHLDAIETAFPELHGRMDQNNVAVVGHSMGGHTASLLLGARLADPNDGAELDFRDRRIKTGVLLAAPGRGGNALNEAAAQRYPFMLTTDFAHMVTPALVVHGDHDDLTPLTVRGPEWLDDPYKLAPGPKSLFTVFDGEHSLGGISGYDAAETTDEHPDRVEAVAALAWAYLQTELGLDADAWSRAQTILESASTSFGRIESK